jgi:hypothetical protein
LRLLEEEENKIKPLKNVISEDVESGINKNLNPENYLPKLKVYKQTNG